MKYIVSGQDKPNNYPLYYVHSYMDSFILDNDICLEEEMSEMESKSSKTKDVQSKTETEDEED